MSRRGAAVLLAMAMVVPATGASAETTDGIWRSQGYGTVRDVYTFRRVGGQVRMHIDGSPGDRVLRAAAMPPRCGEPTPRDPLTTFDVFWRTFDENYPFFAAKGVDWRSVRDRFRPQVTSGTTDARLAEILDGMIAPLNDAHTYLAPGRPPVPHIRPGTVLPSPAYDQEVTSFIEEHDLHRTPASFAKGRIRYADLPHHLGYLRISGFGGYTDTNASPPTRRSSPRPSTPS